MRIFVLSAAAGLMLAPIAASACEFDASPVKAEQTSMRIAEQVGETRAAATQELSAKKKMKKVKKKKEKVEYMRSAAGPEPAPKKVKRAKVKKP
jgi:hypothetical protein